MDKTSVTAGEPCDCDPRDSARSLAGPAGHRREYPSLSVLGPRCSSTAPMSSEEDISQQSHTL